MCIAEYFENKINKSNVLFVITINEVALNTMTSHHSVGFTLALPIPDFDSKTQSFFDKVFSTEDINYIIFYHWIFHDRFEFFFLFKYILYDKTTQTKFYPIFISVDNFYKILSF